MVRTTKALAVVTGASLLACISVSHDGPTGGYVIVSMDVTSADGASGHGDDAGRLEFGSLGNTYVDINCIDTGSACGGEDSASIVGYHWEGGELVPLWAPERALFVRPDWDPDDDVWLEPLPIGNLSCMLGRDSSSPLVLVGECDGPEERALEIVLEMDR